MTGSASARGRANRERIAGIIRREERRAQVQAQRPQPHSPLAGIVPAPAWERAAETVQPLPARMPSQAEARDLEIENVRQAASAQEGRDYSPLSDEWGPIAPLSAMAGDLSQAAMLARRGGGIGSEREQRWARGTRQAGEDILAEGHGGQLMDFFANLPNGMEAAEEARLASGEPRLPGYQARIVDAVGDFWTGMSMGAREPRMRGAAEDAERDYRDREWEIANARGTEAFNRGDFQASGEADLEANLAAREGSLATERGDEAAGADFWNNAPYALEAVPGLGAVDILRDVGRFAGRQTLNSLGREVPEAFARPQTLGEIQRLGEGTLTSEGRGFRNEVAAAGAFGVGTASLADRALSDEGIDGQTFDAVAAPVIGTAMGVAGARYLPRAREFLDDALTGVGDDTLRASRLADNAPDSFEGAPRAPAVIDAEATPVQSETRRINLPQPFVGAADVTVNPSREAIEAILARQGDMPSVKWGVDENGDLLVWDGQATSHGMVSGQPGREGGGFRVHGEIEDPLEIDAALSTAQRNRSGPTRYSADDVAAELGIDPITAQRMLDRDGRLGWPAYGERPQAGDPLDGVDAPRLRPAMRDLGNIDPKTKQPRTYEGDNHFFATEAAEAAGARNIDYTGGFVDEAGNYLTREEAAQRLGISRTRADAGDLERQTVPVGGALENFEGYRPVDTSRDGRADLRPIDPDDPRTRLLADDEEFSGWAGAPTRPRGFDGNDAAAIAGIGATGLGAGIIANEFNQTAQADDGSEGGGESWQLPAAVGLSAAAVAAALRRGRNPREVGYVANDVGLTRRLGGASEAPTGVSPARTFGPSENMVRGVDGTRELGAADEAAFWRPVLNPGADLRGRPNPLEAIEDAVSDLDPRELGQMARAWDIDPHQPKHDVRQQLVRRLSQEHGPSNSNIEGWEESISDVTGGRPFDDGDLLVEMDEADNVVFSRSPAADIARNRWQLDPNDPVVRGVAGAGLGAGGAALLWPQNAEAGGEGEAGGDDPLAYILGAGFSAATIAALLKNKGRGLADEFANSLGSNGGSPPRTPIDGVGEGSARGAQERITTVTPEPAPTANAPRTERQPGAFFNDPRLNSANRDYAASRAADGLTPRQIAAEMDTTADYVRILLTEARDLAPDLNIPLGRPGRTPDADGLTARARALRAQGLSYQEIGEALNMTPTAAKSRVNNRLAGDRRRNETGAAIIAGIGGLTAALSGEEAGAQERGEEITGIDLDGAVKITGHNLERNEDLDEDTVRHTTVWRLPDGSFVLRVQDQNTRNHNPEGPVRVFDLPLIEESERVLDGLEVATTPEEEARHAAAREANAPSNTSSGGQRGQTSRNDRTPAWALAVPALAGIVGGRVGRRALTARGQPILGETVGALGAGGVAGLAAGAATDAEDAAQLTFLGTALGGIGRGGYRAAEAGVRQGAEALANVRLPTPRRRRGQPLTPDDYVGGNASAPINPPGSVSQPLERRADRWADLPSDEGVLARQMDAENIVRGRERFEASPTPVRPEDRTPESLANRLRRGGKGPLRLLAERSGLSTEGTVLDLANRLAEASRTDPALIQQWRDIFQALGVSGVILGGASQLLPQDAEAGVGDDLPDWTDEVGAAAALTGLTLMGRTVLPQALERVVPRNSRIGQLSQVGDLPFHEPAVSLLARGAAARADARLLDTLPFGADTSPALRRLLRDQRGPLHVLDGRADPRDVAAGTLAGGALLAGGAAELIDPLVETPEEKKARWMREVLPYLELRQQAASLFARGVRSNEVADADLAEELRLLERGGGDPLINDYGLGPIGIPDDVQGARATRAREEQKR